MRISNLKSKKGDFMRELSQKFMNDLKGGILSPILERVTKDHTVTSYKGKLYKCLL